jgi:archaellum component FlaF (FlaF/FlaG flagellin family)
MTTQPTAPTAPATAHPTPPILQPGVKASGPARDMSITLDFDTAMAAGNGRIIVTDGAVQTVIDRATGLPTMRVVGATDTHTVSASSLLFDGTEVTLHVTNLLPGHTYSVVMGADALQSSDHVAFGGVRSTSLLSFPTPTVGPALVSAAADGPILKTDGSIAVTLTFS